MEDRGPDIRERLREVPVSMELEEGGFYPSTVDTLAEDLIEAKGWSWQVSYDHHAEVYVAIVAARALLFSGSGEDAATALSEAYLRAVSFRAKPTLKARVRRWARRLLGAEL